MNTRVTRNSRIRLGAIAVVLFVVLASCGMPFEWSGKMPDFGAEPDNGAPDGDGNPGPRPDPPQPQVMTVRGPSFTLAWDSTDPSVVSYRVYRRQPGAGTWELLEPAASEAQITVNEGDLPYGTYEFAVSSVCPEGEESDLHHSFDETADPQPWILRWIEG